MPSNCIFYFYSQQNVQDLLLTCLGKGNVFPFTESAHGILQSEGYGRHNGHSRASLTAAQLTTAKALHHGPAFQQFQPCGRLPPLRSGGMAFLDAAPEKQSGRFRWGPGMWLAAQESPTPGWRGVLNWLVWSESGRPQQLWHQRWTPAVPARLSISPSCSLPCPFHPRPMRYSLFTKTALFTATEALADLSLGFVTAGERLQNVLPNSPPWKLRHRNHESRKLGRKAEQGSKHLPYF